MKKQIIKTSLLVTLILLVGILCFKSFKYYKESKEKQTVYVTDTLTEVVFDTVFLDHYKTQKLYLTDTVTNTIIKDSLRIDSVFVEIPISSYRLDTSFVTDTTTFNLSVRTSGYYVTLDSLFFSFKYTPTLVVPKKNFFKEHFKAGVGVSAGYGFFTKKPDVFVGMGFYYVF